MTYYERKVLDYVEAKGRVSIADVGEHFGREDRWAAKLLLELQLQGELRSWSEPSHRGPARKVYSLVEATSVSVAA